MLIRFTAPNGTPVDVDPASIVRVFPNDGTYHHDAKTVLFTTTGPQAVKEPFDEVEKLLKKV